MVEVEVVDGFYIIEIPKARLVLTREQFVDGLRRGKWWSRRELRAPRHAVMQARADERRSQLT
jgi:hypothetical protein